LEPIRDGRAALGLGVLLALAVSASAVSAQQDAQGRWRATTPASAGRTGVAREARPATVIVVPQNPTVFFNPRQQVFFPSQPVAFFSIPAILMSDGTILADFGMGYEPVTRSCSSQVVATNQVTVVAGNGAVISSGAPTYTQPVPNQATSSQQMLGIGQSSFPTLTTISQASCFTWDGSGRPFVLRP